MMASSVDKKTWEVQVREIIGQAFGQGAELDKVMAQLSHLQAAQMAQLIRLEELLTMSEGDLKQYRTMTDMTISRLKFKISELEVKLERAQRAFAYMAKNETAKLPPGDGNTPPTE